MFIKKLVMHGFKSFPKKTEIPFTEGINVILGPNGSGKSNVSDALCFVLGRLSIKSMRAAKAKNLIFLGTKTIGPAKEASVEMVFDNSDGTFSIEKNEISIKRVVKRNGQSIYKINNETQTRQEVLSLLAQAGIDPNGFNIILQGEIQNFVKMHTEERRKILEEVSGISVYESRKEKSVKELNKTDEKLKEILAVLRERTTYLNNLEKERQQALRFKKLEKDVKRYKASIIFSDLNKNKKEVARINGEIEKRNKEIEKVKKRIVNLQANIENFESRITSINSKIQKSTGLEQEKLNQEIANIRAELAGLGVRLENYENKLSEFSRQKQDLQENICNGEIEIKELQKEISSKNGISKGNQQKEVEKKKQELEELEDRRKKYYLIKSELKAIKGRVLDKRGILKDYTNEAEFLIKQIQIISKELYDKNSSSEKLESLKVILSEKKGMLVTLIRQEKEFERISHTNEYEIEKQRKLIENIEKIDICPICKSKITPEHIDTIHSDIKPGLKKLQAEIEDSDKKLSELYNRKELLEQTIEQIRNEISKREADVVKIANINEKKSQIKEVQGKIDSLKGELVEVEKRERYLERKFDEDSNIEQKYETAKVEVEEISLRNDETVDSEISFKKRGLERDKVALKQIIRNEVDLKEDLDALREDYEEKEGLLDLKREQEEELSRKFQKLIAEREDFQKKIRESEFETSKKENTVQNIEQEANNYKIEKARFDAIVENLEIEMLGFKDVGIIKTNKEILTQKLIKTENILSRIGTVNLRSLEVYDSIKKEYNTINEKVETIEKEKQGILKIIHQIDIRKKKTFFVTLTKLNEIFSNNFNQLSTKGRVFLELENKKDPFEGGVNIVVKLGHGKYFNVTSLSGGEQTLVALALIFAIQELNPYCFYMLDEIDAALDKRNSERLANLLQKYMRKGQYIVITHNDEVITNATNLFGISMHEGISKVISLKI